MAPSDDEEYLTGDNDDQYAPRHDDEYAPRRDETRTRRRMQAHRGTLILVLGILGIVVCAICAPFAWIMGNEDMKKIREGRMDPEGEGLTQAGRIMGIIGTAFIVLGIVIFGFAMCAAMVGGASVEYQ